MRLSDAFEHEGAPFEIPDCGRDDLPGLFRELGFTIGAEIGVERGLFSERLLQAGLMVYSVDPWLHSPNWGSAGSQARQDQLCQETRERLAQYPESRIIRETSVEAADHFGNGALDFVYIDGCHQFRYVAADLQEWVPKVRKGGIISGHDYFTPVKRQRHRWAVPALLEAYTGWYDVGTWYVLGSRNARSGERRDSHRSWMWRKA